MKSGRNDHPDNRDMKLNPVNPEALRKQSEEFQEWRKHQPRVDLTPAFESAIELVEERLKNAKTKEEKTAARFDLKTLRTNLDKEKEKHG